jgi:uncharacterized protein
VKKSVQTNGTLINDRWCDLFVQHDVSVGISIDGPSFLHDAHRVNWSGKGSHRTAMRGYMSLVERGIRPGAICVLTRQSLSYPDEIFDFFADHGFRSIGFNVEEVENSNVTSSLTGLGEIAEEYRCFIGRIYERWQQDPSKITVREISDLLSVIDNKRKYPDYQRKPFETQCLAIITVHKNGDLSTFSPEFAGARSEEFNDFIVGNINSPGSLEEVLTGSLIERIESEVQRGIRACARTCLYFDLCGGAYTSNKFFENGSLCSTETTACRLHRQTLSEVVIEKLTADK